MANITMESTPNNASDEKWMSYAASDCIPWVVLLIVECLAIVILNAVSAVVLVKVHQLQRRGTCLIIHLAIVDFLVGAVAGPVFIQVLGASCNLWENQIWSKKYSWISNLALTLRQLFPYLSLINLTVISLERVYATFFPFKYHVVKKWVYGVIITVTWVISLTLALVGEDVDTTGSRAEFLSFRLVFVLLLLIISVSYISIFVKVRFSHRLPNHNAATARERKLTNTLFMVTLASILTWIPLVIERNVNAYYPQLSNTMFSSHAFRAMLLLCLANSLINPIIYAMRLPELREGIVKNIFRRAPNSLNQGDSPLSNL